MNRPPRTNRHGFLNRLRDDRASSRRRETKRARFLWAETLELRALLSGFDTVNIDSANPVEIPVEDTKAGQTIPLALNFSTGDTTTPEDPENEWVEIRGSDGYQMTVSGYGAQTIQFPISKNGETITAWIDGADGDESGTITVGDRTIQVSVDLAALANPLASLADDLQKAESAIELLTEVTPGWEFFPFKLSKPEVSGKIVGTLSVGPDGSIDAGSLALQGTGSDDAITELYWGLPAHLAGVSGSFTVTLEASLTAKASYDHGVPIFSGEVKDALSGTLAGNLYAVFFKGNVYGKVGAELPLEIASDGTAKASLILTGEVGATLLYKGLKDKSYITLRQISTPIGPYKVTESTYDVSPLFQEAVQFAESLGDPLMVTAQPPTTAVAGSRFGLTVTATNPDGSVNKAFNGPVTISDPGKSDLGGVTTLNAVNGVAVFSGLSLSGAGSHQLYASSAVGSIYTSPVDVTAAPTRSPAPSTGGPAATPAVAVSQFSIVSQVGTKPAGWVGGQPLVNPGEPFSVTVDARASNGSLLASYNGPVTLALANNPSGATLGGTLTVNAVNGVATFNGLTLNKTGSGFELTTVGGATTPGTSNLFDVADLLAIKTAAPGSVVAGSPFGLVVAARDFSGKVDPSFSGNVTVSESNYSGGSTTLIKGAVTVKAVKGVATFSGLTLDQAGYYSLVLNGDGAAFTSQLFQVTPGKATQLVVATGPPPAVTAGAPFAVQVRAEDAYGNVDPTASGQVTLSLSGPSGTSLGGTTTLALSGGVASFSGLKVGTAGAGNVLKVGGAGLPATTSSAFDVRPAGHATRLVITSPGSTLSEAAGAPFGLVIKAEDDNGTVDPNFTGTVTLALAPNAAGASLGGKASVAAVNGVATFAGLSVDVASSFQLQATAAGLTSLPPASLGISPGAAAQLIISSPSGSLVTGTDLTTTVLVEDAFGNIVTSGATVAIGLGANPGGAKLSGTLTAFASGGTATFSNLVIDKPGSGYTLKATSGSLHAAVSAPFDVENDQLAVTTSPPSGVAAGSPFGLIVQAQGPTGVVDTSFNGQVTLGLVSYHGGMPTLSGQVTVTASNGVAVFSGLSIDQVGSYALTAAAGGATSASTGAFVVSASSLAIQGEPPTVVNAGAPFSLTVTAGDPAGNVDTTYNGPVTIALASNLGGATLGGTLTVDAVDGVATFTGLTLDKPASGYALKATAAGLAAGTSAAIAVVPPGVATQLVLLAAPPAGVTAGSPFGLVVEAEDSFGHLITSFNGRVTLSDSQGALAGPLTVTASGGMAGFPGLTIDQAWPFDSLTASAAGLVPAAAGTIGVTNGPATRLQVSAPAGSVLAGTSFGVEVSAVDAYGNLDPSYNGPVTLSLGSNPGGAALGGTLTATAVGGIASFPAISISKSSDGETLVAAGAGGLSGVGSPIDVTADQLVFATAPSGVAAGSPFGVVVAAVNAAGAVDSTFTGDITVDAPGFGQALGGTTTLKAVHGVAIFTGLTLDVAFAPGSALIATSGGLPAAISGAFAVAPAAATHLAALIGPPVAVTAGAPFEVDVAAEDALGNVQTSYNGPVTIALAGHPGATLGGTLTVTAVNGVADFRGLTIAAANSGYSIVAAASGLAPVASSAIRVSPPGVATRLVVVTEPPATLAAGTPFGLVVAAEDSFGALDPTFHGVVTVTDPSGAALGGIATATASGGVVGFPNLTLTQAGTGVVLSATSAGLQAAATDAFDVDALAATQLVVTAPAGNTLAGVPFGTIVYAEDPYGNVDPTYNGTVTLALAGNATGVTLGGTPVATASGGSAVFSGLSISKPGANYALQAQAAGLAPSAPSSLDVTADQLVVTAQPTAAVAAGTGFVLTVVAQSPSGGVDTAFAGPVTLSLLDLGNTGATLGGPLTATAVGGVATFTGLTLDRAGNYVVSASSGGVAGADTSPIVVGTSTTTGTTPATATILSDHPAGSTYGQQVTLVVSVRGPAGTPTGSVQFVVDGAAFGAPVALTNGAAVSPGLAGLGAGVHYVAAVYIGDATYAPAGSPILSEAIAPAPLLIVSNSATKVYGQANPPIFAAGLGFVLGQGLADLTGTLSVSTTATAASHFGLYPVVAAGLASANYAIAYVPGVIAVTPAPLVIAAGALSRPYGQPNPLVPASNYFGLVNGDTPGSLTTPAALATAAGAASPVGTYATTVSGASSPDYTIVYVPGTLTVTPPPAGLSAAGQGWMAFATVLYQEVLGRNPDPAGLASWVQALGRGASPAAVASAFWNSPEHVLLLATGRAPRVALATALADARAASSIASGLAPKGPLSLAAWPGWL